MAGKRRHAVRQVATQQPLYGDTRNSHCGADANDRQRQGGAPDRPIKGRAVNAHELSHFGDREQRACGGRATSDSTAPPGWQHFPRASDRHAGTAPRWE